MLLKLSLVRALLIMLLLYSIMIPQEYLLVRR